MEHRRIIEDRFELERLAGAGAMGSVYRAWDHKLGKAVALKLVHDPADAPRFDREAATLEAIDHPGIVRYEAHGRTQLQEAYIAMEWLEGETLSSRLERGPLTLAEALSLGSAMARALGAAHAAGIVHRDLKPGNVLLVGGSLERPKLVDFGIAHSADLSAGEQAQGEWIGTPGYMPPEQMRAGGRATPASDVYSLGCILFRALTGRLPYEGATSVEILQQAARKDAPRLRQLVAQTPLALEDLVASMLAREAKHRPADGARVAEELERLRPKPIASASLAQARELGRRPRVRSIALAVLFAFALFGCVLWLLLRARRPPREPSEAQAGEALAPRTDLGAVGSASPAGCEEAGTTYQTCLPLAQPLPQDLVALLSPLRHAARQLEPTAALAGLTAICHRGQGGDLTCPHAELRVQYRYRRGDGLLGSLSLRVLTEHLAFERSDAEPAAAVLDPPACDARVLLQRASANGRLSGAALHVSYERSGKLDRWQVQDASTAVNVDAARCALID